MDLELIKQLMQLMAANMMIELEYEASDVRLRLKRDGAPQLVPTDAQSAVPRASDVLMEAAAEGGADEEEPAPDVAVVKSPIVGTFYRAPAPGADPFVGEGDYVAKSQTLCIVEAMKVMNEIESDFDGRILKILIDDAHPVEFGQPLLWIEPTT